MTETTSTGSTWPPGFTLDQERILTLLTGDRFYSNPSAALREAILNAIDAIQKRRRTSKDLVPEIAVNFDSEELTLSVADNGVGMNRADVQNLFAKVGASAATAEQNKDSVGEFGIGVVSYFMAGDSFDLETHDGESAPIGLRFHKKMLAGAPATEITPTQTQRGTSLKIKLRDKSVYDLFIHQLPHWCRDVDGLVARVLPAQEILAQGGSHRVGNAVGVPPIDWVQRAHLGPVANPTGWNQMTGHSTVSVLYRGVFVQEYSVKGLWGIEGSIDVDPKRFKPRLNREGFIDGEFQNDVQNYLRMCHPSILCAMAGRLSEAAARGELDKWDQKRWATLWLAVPRTSAYSEAVKAWDAVFRSLPAFELAEGNNWRAVSLNRLIAISGEIYVAPLQEEKVDDVVWAAVRLLRNTGRSVIRGVRKDNSWMKFSGASFSTTADLITSVFSSDLPPLKPIAPIAHQLLSEIARTAPLFTGPPPIDIVKLGAESPPALRLVDRLVINIDHPAGAAIVTDVLQQNAGPASLIGITAMRSYEHLGQVAAAVRDIKALPEILSPIRRRYIRSRVS